jgi:hypothetical protein
MLVAYPTSLAMKFPLVDPCEMDLTVRYRMRGDGLYRVDERTEVRPMGAVAFQAHHVVK